MRVRSIIERTLARDGFAGVMSYSLDESVWLADLGVDDILLAYPTASATGLAALVQNPHRLDAITLMIDSRESLDLIDRRTRPGHAVIGVCIDVDASLKHRDRCTSESGDRRCTRQTTRPTWRAHVAARKGFELRGVMFYDAQIAGLPDSSPAVRLVKKRSAAELLERRSKVVAAVRRARRPADRQRRRHRQPRGHRRRSRHHRADRRVGTVQSRPVRRLRRVRVASGRLLRARRRPQADRRRRDPVLRRLHRLRADAEEPAAQAGLAGGSLAAQRRGCR